jgi:hypothetical protein
MSDPVEVKFPAALALTSDPGPVAAARAERAEELTNMAAGVMYLDTRNNREIIKRETRLYEKTSAALERAKERLHAIAKRAVSELKSEGDTAAVVKALRELGFNVRFRPEFKSLDLATEDQASVRYAWVQEDVGGTGWRGTSEGRTLELNMPTDSADALAEYWKQYKEERRCREAIILAEERLRDRSNRLADAQGVIALQSMAPEKLAKVKKAYSAIDSDKLLAELNTEPEAPVGG